MTDFVKAFLPGEHWGRHTVIVHRDGDDLGWAVKVYDRYSFAADADQIVEKGELDGYATRVEHNELKHGWPTLEAKWPLVGVCDMDADTVRVTGDAPSWAARYLGGTSD